MAQYRKKPVVIEAVQWQPGIAVEGVKQCDPELIFSGNGKHYYLSAMGEGGGRADAWLPVDETSNDEVMPFAFWEVKSAGHMKALITDPLVRRYMDRMGWTELPKPYGIVETLEGKMTCNPGDWIITGVKGEKYPCKPDIFAATYEPA